MKNNEKPHELKLSSLDFIIAPLMLTTKQPQAAHQYLIEFDKGAQILKKFDEAALTAPQQNSYHFSRAEQGRFKLQSQRGSCCEWGVYRVTSKDMSEFVDSLPVNLLDYFTAFNNSIKSAHWDYSHMLSLRAQGKEIGKLWEEMKHRLKCQFPQLVAKNRSGNIELHFRLEIRCEADTWAEAERQKALKPMKSAKSLGERNSNVTINGTNPRENQEEDDLLPKNSVLSKPKPPLPLLNQQAQQPLVVRFKQQPLPAFEEQPKIIEPPPQMQAQPIYKKNSALSDIVLSDIIECSVECSSNFNDRQKRNELKEISGIPQEENENHSPYLPNTRTQNFDVTEQMRQILKKRSNTYNQLPSQMDESLEESRRIHMDFHRDEELQKEELRENIETLPQSEISHHEKAEATLLKEAKRGGRTKYIAAFVLCLLIIGGLAFATHIEEANEKPQVKKTHQPKKPQQKKKVRKGVKQ